MVEVSKVKRKSAVLSPSSLDCLSNIPTLNITLGCAHGCIYCYSRGYSIYPGDEVVKVYENTLIKLKKELPRKRQKPRAVYFSPSSDVFQPVPEVLDITYGIFKYLLGLNFGIAFLTKGKIPKKHMELLKAHSGHVRAQVGLITLDNRILKTFEPRAADAETRLSQISELTKAGIRTQVRLDPILPGLTDDEDTLHRLLRAIEDTGVKRIAASILFLRPAIANSLREKKSGREMCEALLGRFEKARRLEIHAEHSRVIALTTKERKEIFTMVKEIAKEYGIGVKICACKNPDLASGTCSIAGDWIKPIKGEEQLSLFKRTGRR